MRRIVPKDGVEYTEYKHCAYIAGRRDFKYVPQGLIGVWLFHQDSPTASKGEFGAILGVTRI